MIITADAKCCMTCLYYQAYDDITGFCNNHESYNYDYDMAHNTTCPYWKEIPDEPSFTDGARVQDS